MSKNCETVYLDENGERSSIYYSIQKDKGHDAALEAYLMYMSDKVAFKKTGDFEALIADQKVYDSAKMIGITTVIKKNQEITKDGNTAQGKNEDEMANNVAIKLQARSIMLRNPDRFDISNELYNLDIMGLDRIKLSENALSEAKEFYDKNPDELKKSVANIKENWKYHKESGKELHEFIDKFYTQLEGNKTEKDGYPLITRVKGSDKESVLDDYINFTDLGSREKDMRKVLVDIHNSVTQLLKSKGVINYEILPEFKMTSAAIDLKGSLDLVIHDKDNNKIIIIDFKFKDEGKEFLFNTKEFGRMHGAFNGLYANKQTEAEIQLTAYKLMFEKAGFLPQNISTFILPITGKPLENADGKRIGYENMKVTKFIPTTYHRSMLGVYLKTKNINIDEEEVIEKDKLNTSYDIIKDLSDGKAELSHSSPEKLADKYLAKIPLIDEITGKEYFKDHLENQKVFFDTTDKVKRRTQMIEYFKRKIKDHDRISNDIINYFNELKKDPDAEFPGDPNNSIVAALETQAKHIISSILEGDYTLQQLKNINGFEKEDPNILIAKNNKTGSAKIFYTLRQRDRNIKLSDEKDDTIFSNYSRNKTMIYEHGFKGMKSTLANFKIIECGILGLKLKKNNYITSIENVSSVVVNGSLNTGGEPSVAYMSDILPQLEIIPSILKGKLSTNLNALLNDKSLLSSSSHTLNHVNELLDLMINSNDFKPLSKNDFDKKIKEGISIYNIQKNNKKEMLSMLYKAQDIMYASLKNKIPPNNPALLSKNKEWSLLANAILQVANISFDSDDVSRERRRGLDGDEIKQYSNYDSHVIQTLVTVDHSAQLETKRKYDKFQIEHSDIVRDLKESFYNSRSTLTTTADQSEVFKNLYIFKDNKNTFKLKSKDDPSLNSIEKKYIEFFNNNVKKGFSYTLEETKFKSFDKDWEEGTVPLKAASVSTRITKADGFGGKLKETIQNLKYKGVKQSKDAVDSLFYLLKNNYENQLKTDGHEGGCDARRSLLNIDEDGQALDNEPTMLEENLESILNDFMADSITQLSYEPAFAIFNAIQVKLFFEEQTHFKMTRDLRQTVDTYLKMNIFNQYKDDGKMGKILDVTKNLTNYFVMAGPGGSPKQIGQEYGQNSLAEKAFLLNNMVAKLFKDEDAFLKSPVKSSLEANKYSLAVEKMSEDNFKISNFVSQDFAFFSGDLNSMKSDEFKETRRGGIAQSKWLMFLNGKPYRHFFAHAFFTKLIDDGAMSGYTVVNGAVVYNVSLDKRFKDIFENGKLKINVTTDNEKKQLSFYKSLLKDLNNEEEGVNADGRPNRPYSTLEIISMKNKFMKSFGSMDRNAKVEAQQHATWRSVLTYKNYFLSKKDNYWTETSYKLSKGSRVTVKDEETGEYFSEFRPQLDEGIIQTLQFAFTQVISSMKDSQYQKIAYSPIQKENLRKALVDLTLLALLTLLMMGLKDMFKDEKGRYFYGMAINAINDLNIFTTTNSMLTGNPFAVAGALGRVMSSTVSAITYGIEGDYDEAVKSGMKVTAFSKFAYTSMN
jgi:hypothetical protein